MIAYSEPIHPYVFRVELIPTHRLRPLPGRFSLWSWEIMVRLYSPTADLLPGIRDPFLFGIPDTEHAPTADLLPAIAADHWTTLGYEQGGCGSSLSLRRAIVHADKAVWSFYERLSNEAEKGVKIR